MELFKKLGPRVILVEYHGKLTGLVTVKDCLKYQFTTESHEHLKDDSTLQELQEKLWVFIRTAGVWIYERVADLSGGRLLLDEPGEPAPIAIPPLSTTRTVDRGRNRLTSHEPSQR